MEPRLDYVKASPQAYRAMAQLEALVRHRGLQASLVELVKIRASQMNGCAFCIDMHTKDARPQGETEQRIYALDAWRETPFFSDRERAALAWTEAITNIQQGHAPQGGVPGVEPVFQRIGTGASDACNYDDQCMEPHRDWVPPAARQLSAGEGHGLEAAEDLFSPSIASM